MKKRLMGLLLLTLLCVCLGASAEDYALPVDFSGGYTPSEANYTKDAYEDESLSVKMEKRDVDGVRYDIA